MSARSSSGSWSGAGRASPDIIDLDKFMRGAVRPARADAHTLRCSGDKLVVDAGGVDRKSATLSPAAPAPTAPAAPVLPLTAPSDSSGSRPRPHGKRFSHDSGLSDTSYARRKHRPHRRAVGGDNNGVRAPRTPAAGSNDSLRAFRAVCERALLDQQAQIARVAQLCERLSERPPPRRRSDRSATDTSDVSSSSRSTRDQRRKDKHRTDECKTYKIIMNKLDELNRLFAARARSPPPAARSPPPPAPRRLPVSSGSVSVSDKLVATEPEGAERPRDLQIALNAVTIRGDSTYGACGSCGAGARALGGAGGSCGAGGSSRLAGLRAVTNTCALDIPPREALPRHNIATESARAARARAPAAATRAAGSTSTTPCICTRKRNGCKRCRRRRGVLAAWSPPRGASIASSSSSPTSVRSGRNSRSEHTRTRALAPSGRASRRSARSAAATGARSRSTLPRKSSAAPLPPCADV